MSDYTLVEFDEVENMAERFGLPWEMRFLKEPLGTEQVAVSYWRLPAGTGQRGVFGHRHKTQEEVYVVISGTVVFRLDDESVTVSCPAAVRVAPETARAIHNDSDEQAEILIVSKRVPNLREDVEQLENFWTED